MALGVATKPSLQGGTRQVGHTVFAQADELERANRISVLAQRRAVVAMELTADVTAIAAKRTRQTIAGSPRTRYDE